MSSPGKNEHQREVVRAGETLKVTARTPGQGGQGNEVKTEDWKTAARVMAIKGRELWRLQPLREFWGNWTASDSETLKDCLKQSDTRWSREAPSFAVTPQGLVHMSWEGKERVPLLVVDQLRSYEDHVEPPPHPESTYTTLKRKWLRNLTVVTIAMPGVDIDRGHLHDYRKALRLSVVHACFIMREPCPLNYHARLAMWELAQEPQPTPFTLEQAAFDKHKEERLRIAQKRHRSLEAHYRRYVKKYQSRAQEAEERELERQLEIADDTTGRTAIKRPRAYQPEKSTVTATLADKAGGQSLRVLTFREEAKRDEKEWHSIAYSRHSKEAMRAQQTAVEEGDGSAPQPNTPSEESVTEAARGQPTILGGEGETQRLDTREETVTQSGTRDDASKPPQVLRPWAAGLWGEEECQMPEITAPRNERSLPSAIRSSEAEPRTAVAAEEAAVPAGTEGKETESPRILRLVAAGSGEEEASREPGPTSPPAKRRKDALTYNWTAAKETDHTWRTDSPNRYHSRETNTASLRTRPEYPVSLLFDIATNFKTLYPQTAIEALEHLLRGLDDAVENDRAWRRMRTIEEWRRSAATGVLDNLGMAVAGKVERNGGMFNRGGMKGVPTNHMAQTIMNRVVQELQREHRHLTSDYAHPHHSAVGTQRPQERGGYKGRTPALVRDESTKLARVVINEDTRQLSEKGGAEAAKTELRDTGAGMGTATETPCTSNGLAEDLSDMSSEEGDLPWPSEVGRLPMALGRLLENAMEVLWPGLSAKKITIFLRELEATIHDSASLRGLGSDKQKWRIQAALTETATLGETLRIRLRKYPTFNGANSDEATKEENFPGQDIIDAAWGEWLKDVAMTGPQGQEHLPNAAEQIVPLNKVQVAAAAKEDVAQLRRGRGCVNLRQREGIFICEDGTRFRGQVRVSSLPADAVAQPSEWNNHMHVCAQGCDLLPLLTPERLKNQLRAGKATVVSLCIEGRERLEGALFMRSQEMVRRSKLRGYNVDGIAVQEDMRGRGLGTLLLQVAQEEAILAAKEDGQDRGKATVSITVQESLHRWLYKLGFTKSTEGRNISWGPNSANLYWQPDDLDLKALANWKWTARGMVNPDSLCHLVTVVQVLLGNEVFTRYLAASTWPEWGAGDTLLRIMLRPRDPSIEPPIERFRDIQDQRHHSRELILRLFYVLNGKGRAERMLSEQQDVSETLTALSKALDEEQAEQTPVFLQSTRPSWTEQIWGVKKRITRSCTECQSERILEETRDLEVRVVASETDQQLAEQLQQLTDTMEDMEADSCDCGKRATWLRGTVIDSVGRLLWVHINRNQSNECYRISGRVRCPTTLMVRTANEIAGLRLTGLVAHTGKTAPIVLPDGQTAAIVAGGHYVANVHWQKKGRDWVSHLDDSALPYEASHQEVFSSLAMIRTEGGGVESLALYQRTDTNHSARQCEGTDMQLRLSLGSLGATVQECPQRGSGGISTKGTRRHDLEEPRTWNIPKGALESMRSAWRHALLNTHALAPDGDEPGELQRHLASKETELSQAKQGVEAMDNVLRNCKSHMRSRTFWPGARAHLIVTGHYWEPLSCAAPMLCWFGGVHKLANGMTAGIRQTGITVLLFSEESLQLAGLDRGDSNSEWTYERLLSQLKQLGCANGIGIQCRIARLTEESPMITWPGDWHAYVVGDSTLNDEGTCCSLVTAAWRPAAAQRIADAKDALNNTGTVETIRRLERLGFPQPAKTSALAWLQEGTTRWDRNELEFMTMLEQEKQGRKKQKTDAPPVKEPKKHTVL